MLCRSCGKEMHTRGARRRLVRGENGRKIFIRIGLYWCPKCNIWARELPNDILPFKQYPESVINASNKGLLKDDERYLDGPSEATKMRWKKL